METGQAGFLVLLVPTNEGTLLCLSPSAAVLRWLFLYNVLEMSYKGEWLAGRLGETAEADKLRNPVPCQSRGHLRKPPLSSSLCWPSPCGSLIDPIRSEQRT